MWFFGKFRKSKLRFSRRDKYAKLNANVEIDDKYVKKFKEGVVNYAEECAKKGNSPAYKKPKIISLIKREELISEIYVSDNRVRVNISEGSLEAKLRDSFLRVNAEGEINFVETVYKLLKERVV